MSNKFDTMFRPMSTTSPVLRPQGNRRALVIVFLILVLVTLILTTIKQDVFAWVSVVVSIAFYVLLNFATRGVTGAAGSGIDERDIHLRDRVHWRAFSLHLFLFGMVFGAHLTLGWMLKREEYFAIFTYLGPWGISLLLLNFSVLSMALPTLVLAWLEPTPLSDNE